MPGIGGFVLTFQRAKSLLCALAVFATTLGVCENAFESLVSEKEFQDLAIVCANKVPLFQKVWSDDPKAQIFGGTSRDFLFWLKSQFHEASSREEIDKIAASLKGRSHIDIKQFLAPGSDIDILTEKTTLPSAIAEGSGYRIDVRSKSKLDPNTSAGKDERNQGYLPVEKIAIGAQDISLSEGFGNGLKEILSGNITVTITPHDIFKETSYARAGKNHQTLLALRYIRALSMNYFATSGRASRDARSVLNHVPPGVKQTLQAIFDGARDDSHFRALLDSHYFFHKMNSTVHKAFDSMTHSGATIELFRALHADKMIEKTKIQPINQYLFAKDWNKTTNERFLTEFGVARDKFFDPISKHFPNGYGYHGTPTEDAFRKILLNGVLPSRGGTAGEGLYITNSSQLDIPSSYAQSSDRIVKFPIHEGTRIVDVTTGEGQRIFHAYSAKYGGNYEKFAENFGIDIVKYPYNGNDAFVVKNSRAIGVPSGHSRDVLSTDELILEASHVSSDEQLNDFLKRVSGNLTNEIDRSRIFEALKFSANALSSEDLSRANEQLFKLAKAGFVIDELTRFIESSNSPLWNHLQGEASKVVDTISSPGLRDLMRRRLIDLSLAFCAKENLPALESRVADSLRMSIRYLELVPEFRNHPEKNIATNLLIGQLRKHVSQINQGDPLIHGIFQQAARREEALSQSFHAKFAQQQQPLILIAILTNFSAFGGLVMSGMDHASLFAYGFAGFGLFIGGAAQLGFYLEKNYVTNESRKARLAAGITDELLLAPHFADTIGTKTLSKYWLEALEEKQLPKQPKETPQCRIAYKIMAPYKIAFTTGAIFSTAVMLKLYFYPKNPKTNDTNQENPTQSNPIQTVTAEQLKNLPISEFHTPVVSGFLKPHFENDQWSQDLMVTMSGLPKDKKGEEVRLEITPKPTESAVADHPDGPVTGSIRAKNGVVYLVGIQTTKQGEIDVKMPFANLNNDGSITVHQGVNVNGKILRKISVGKEPELISKIWIQFPGATALK